MRSRACRRSVRLWKIVACITIAHLAVAYATVTVKVEVCEAVGAKAKCVSARLQAAAGAVMDSSGAGRIGKRRLGRGGRLIPESATRDAIQALIAAQGAVGTRRVDVARVVGVSPSTARYHVSKLIEMGLVTEVRKRARRREFDGDFGFYRVVEVRTGLLVPTGSNEEQVLSKAALTHPDRARLYALLQVNPDASLGEAARTLGVTRATVHEHKVVLMEAGVLPWPQ